MAFSWSCVFFGCNGHIVGAPSLSVLIRAGGSLCSDTRRAVSLVDTAGRGTCKCKFLKLGGKLGAEPLVACCGNPAHDRPSSTKMLCA